MSTAADDLEGATGDGMTLAGALPAGPHVYDVMGTVRWWRGEYTVRARTTCGEDGQTMEVRFRVGPAGR